MPYNSVHELETAGIKANGNKIFNFELTGPQVYTLTEILRKLAINSNNYMDIANAVECHEFIMAQAKGQGF